LAIASIIRIRVKNFETGEIYAEGLEFSVTPPPPGTSCNWEIEIRNLSSETKTLYFHIYQLEPFTGDWVYQGIPVGPGQTAGLGARWGYPRSRVVWRFSVDVDGKIEDSYIVTAEPDKLTCVHEGLPPTEFPWDVFVSVFVRYPNGEVYPARQTQVQVQIKDEFGNASSWHNTDPNGNVFFTNAEYPWLIGTEQGKRYTITARFREQPEVSTSINITLGKDEWW